MSKRKPPVYDAEFFEPTAKRQSGLDLGWAVWIALAILTLFWIVVLGAMLT